MLYGDSQNSPVVGGGDLEDVITGGPQRGPGHLVLTYLPHPLASPCPWNVYSAHHSHGGAISKDTALRSPCVVETIWVIFLTKHGASVET